MAYEAHSNVETPEDSIVLWRYMDLARFLYLLDGRLWFSRLDRADDPQEEMHTDAETARLEALNAPPGLPCSESPGRSHLRAAEWFRSRAFASCWFEGAQESIAMWDIYGGRNGVAVRSTMGALKESLSGAVRPVHIGRVEYVDWGDAPWHNNLIAMSYRKRPAFNHEREVRALVCNCDGSSPITAGMEFDVKPEALISCVLVSPRAEGWHVDLVRRLVQGKGIGVGVEGSRLLERRQQLSH